MCLEFSFFWILFLSGVILVFLTKLSAKQKIVAVLFTVFSFLTVCPGLYFRQHYFISFLPAVGLLCGIALFYLSTLITKFTKIRQVGFFPFAVFCIATFVELSNNKAYYFNAE